MKVNSDVYRRPEPCKRSPLSILKSVIVLLIVAYFAIALLGIVAGQIGDKLDQHDAAQKQKTAERIEKSPAFKKLAKEMLGEW